MKKHILSLSSTLKELKSHLHNKRKKLVELYGVFEKKIDMNNAAYQRVSPQALAGAQLLTVTPTKKDAFAAIDKLIYFDHFDHYKLWCDAHSETVGVREKSWIQYKRDVITLKTYQEEFNTYSVYSMAYSKQNLASFLRVFSKCKPLLTDFEDPQELQNFFAAMSKENGAVGVPLYLFKLMGADPTDGEKLSILFDMDKAARAHEQQQQQQEEQKEN